MLNKKKSGLYILMSFAMLSWAVAWTSAKIVNEYLSFYNLVFLRFLFGFIFLIPFVLNQSILKNLNFKNIIYILITSMLFFIYNIAFFNGTYYGLAGKGAILVTTINPIVTVIIISMINKSITIKNFIGMLIGFIGGMIIIDVFSLGLEIIFNNENYYFLICAITWGIITILSNYGQKSINSIIFIFLCYLTTTILSMPFIEINNIFFSNLDIKFYFNFFLVSIGAMAFGTSIYIYATKVIGPVKSSAFIFSVPILAISTSHIFLNEPLSTNVIIGGLLSLLGVYIVNK